MNFKEQLETNFLPRLDKLIRAEKDHLHWLIDEGASSDFLRDTQRIHFQLLETRKQYEEYLRLEKLK